MLREDSSVVNRADYLYRTTDVFGKMIADGTRNVLDVPSHYPYNPERWRIMVDGTRVFPEYDTVTQYTHGGDVHELTPAAGETVILETNELPRYVVQYEQVASFAWNLNKSLVSGDIARVGPFDDDNGWFIEHNGDHTDNQVDLVIRRDGTDTRVENVSLPKSVLNWNMYRNRYSWYNVGPSEWQQFYADGNDGIIKEIGKIAIEGTDRGPKKGNVPLRYEITASGSTTGLQMNAGSCALVVLGNTRIRTRAKSHKFEDAIGTINTWNALRVFQVKDDYKIINTSLLKMYALNYSEDADVEIAAMIMPNEKVTFDADGWSTPELWNATNNALETRSDITGFPDNSGTIGATATNPGGYQVGRAAIELLGAQLRQGVMPSEVESIKRDMPNLDYLVIIGKSATAGTVTYEIEFEQDW